MSTAFVRMSNKNQENNPPTFTSPPNSSFSFTPSSSPFTLNPRFTLDSSRVTPEFDQGSHHQPRSQTDGLSFNLRDMRLSDPGGIENMRELADVVATVEESSENRRVSLAPEDHSTASTHNTPRNRRRSRRSSSRGDTDHHNVSEEEMPEGAFHTPEFQKAFHDAKQLVVQMEGVLGSSSLHREPESTIGRLHEEALALASFQYPATRTVGFVGESGVGKSSLLNSLLDSKGLARTSNSGEACTCVPTEYHFHPKDGFDIEVSLFSEEELHQQLIEMVTSYRHFHLHKNEMDSAERAFKEEKANLAQDTLQAMFRGRLGDKSFLTKQPQEAVIRRLVQWAADLRPSSNRDRLSGLNLHDCSTALMELSSEPPSKEEPAKWPYFRHIKVFSNAHILSRGLILVDLPGLRDLNSARRLITERYLLECDEIFAICNSGRAVTDEGVRDVLRLAERARLSNVGIICTRSDDIDAEEALRDWRQDSRKDKIEELMEALKADEEEEKEIQDGIDEYGLEDDLTPEEQEDRRRLWRDQKHIRLQKDSHHFQMRDYLINTRNQHVRQELMTTYSDQVSERDVKVFCISNKIYWDHREDPKVQALRWLKLSGILEIRRHCISIVAHSQRKAAQRYMRTEIPALLAQIDLWVQSGARTASEERRAALCKALDETEKQLKRDLNARACITNSIAKLFLQDFTIQIYEKRNIASWSRSAQAAGSDWSTWHPGSYAAFCRNFGDYSTPTIGYRNWNKEALDGMVEDLENPWERLESSLEQRQTQLAEFVETTTDTVIEKFEDSLDSHEDELDPLVQTLATQQQLLLYAIESSQENFEVNLRRLHTDSFSGNESSIFGKSMRDTYKNCNLESGRGSDGRRKAIMNSTLGDKELFRNLVTDMKGIFKAHANIFQDEAQAGIASFLSAVKRAFDLIRSENVARESERDPEFRLRVEALVKTSQEQLRGLRDMAL